MYALQSKVRDELIFEWKHKHKHILHNSNAQQKLNIQLYIYKTELCFCCVFSFYFFFFFFFSFLFILNFKNTQITQKRCQFVFIVIIVFQTNRANRAKLNDKSRNVQNKNTLHMRARKHTNFHFTFSSCSSLNHSTGSENMYVYFDKLCTESYKCKYITIMVCFTQGSVLTQMLNAQKYLNPSDSLKSI